MSLSTVFITGGTGYIGQALISLLIQRQHHVRALVRRGSEQKLPAGCEPIIGNALDKQSFVGSIPPAQTFVQLVGTSHPGPAKADEFRSVDLVSGRASIEAAVESGIKHFVYVSVAQPAPIMREYIDARRECEDFIREKKLNATILRPWYVLGKGHRWPLILLPAYWLFELIPSTKDSARRLGFVTLQQMLCTLVSAVERPYSGIRIIEVPEIKRTGTVASEKK